MATIFVTYQQNGRNVIEKTGSDLSVIATEAGCSVSLNLTQEDTLKLQPGRVAVQIRYVMEDGTADASNIIQIDAKAILKDGVIEYAV